MNSEVINAANEERGKVAISAFCAASRDYIEKNGVRVFMDNDNLVYVLEEGHLSEPMTHCAADAMLYAESKAKI